MMSIAAIIPVVGAVLDRILPDKNASEAAKLKLTELAQAGQLAELDAAVRLATGQMDVNRQEAASGDWFRAGWRPAVGWVLAAALAYQYVGHPLLVWSCAVWWSDVTPPAIGLDDNLWELLFGMLGLAAVRSWEKIKKPGA